MDSPCIPVGVCLGAVPIHAGDDPLVAEIMESILAELDPTGRLEYLPLLREPYGQREALCEISQEALAAPYGVIQETVKSPLAIARSIGVEQGETKSHAARYRNDLTRAAGLSPTLSCHTFRPTRITADLLSGGTAEGTQKIAAHASTSMTKLYDHRDDTNTFHEVERIGS